MDFGTGYSDIYCILISKENSKKRKKQLAAYTYIKGGFPTCDQFYTRSRLRRDIVYAYFVLDSINNASEMKHYLLKNKIKVI